MNAPAIALPASRDHDLADRHRFGDETASASSTTASRRWFTTSACAWRGTPRGPSIALNHCRSRLGRRGLELEDWDDQRWSKGPVDPAWSPEEESMARDGERRIAAALLALPVRFREAVVLRDLEGLSYEEIATVLGVRTGTVRSRIARGRERLRAVLAGG
jgi:RNA polymerase sigma factor (sigma-70 family)